MYLVGAEHRHKHDAQRLLDSAISRRERLVTDAEVLQEILHRYHAIDRYDAIQPALDLVLAVTAHVIPIDRDVVLRAKEILLGRKGLSARDAVHVAAMESVGSTTIMSFDSDFDGYPGLARLS
jgi:predicted nucleic acid-binding protein